MKVADGTFVVARQISISITQTLSINFVLHIPKLLVILLSISQITKKLNCSVTFFSSHCVFGPSYSEGD